uniref:Uncharacterized protein n=1 Tax=Myotis myotis TaxID=51298 RepID=A0A7J7U5H5_MYOMY|nr:hypothetical protein mMyoMyo1_008829 [Myotis myotis]
MHKNVSLIGSPPSAKESAGSPWPTGSKSQLRPVLLLLPLLSNAPLGLLPAPLGPSPPRSLPLLFPPHFFRTPALNCAHTKPHLLQHAFRGLHWDPPFFHLQLHLVLILHSKLTLGFSATGGTWGQRRASFRDPCVSPKHRAELLLLQGPPPGRVGVRPCPSRPPLLLRHLLCISLSQASAGAGD